MALVAAVTLWRQVGSLRTQLHKLQTANTADSETTRQGLAALNSATNGLAARTGALEAKAAAQPDPATIAKKVQASVFIISTRFGLGSGWVVSATAGSSILITNFHVISDIWTSGERNVEVKQSDATYPGTIIQVDITDDLALITTPEIFPLLRRATGDPAVGDSVLVVGAPLGLGGTVTNGIVSALRVEDGRHYVQFSAPISPGNSGGPVVDSGGAVIGITEAKLVALGAEGLSLAIPVSYLCSGLSLC